MSTKTASGFRGVGSRERGGSVRQDSKKKKKKGKINRNEQKEMFDGRKKATYLPRRWSQT